MDNPTYETNCTENQARGLRKFQTTMRIEPGNRYRTGQQGPFLHRNSRKISQNSPVSTFASFFPRRPVPPSLLHILSILTALRPYVTGACKLDRQLQVTPHPFHPSYPHTCPRAILSNPSMAISPIGGICEGLDLTAVCIMNGMKVRIAMYCLDDEDGAYNRTKASW